MKGRFIGSVNRQKAWTANVKIAAELASGAFAHYLSPPMEKIVIVGSGCAIAIGGGITTGNAVITNNHFINNSTGICPSQYVRVPMTIEGNTFVQSSVAAIDIPNCNDGVANIIKGNTFVGAPAGIVGLDRFDVLAGNNFYDVTSPTTACPDK